MSILILDVNDSLRELLVDSIESLGHKTHEASTIAQAINILENYKISIILSAYKFGTKNPDQLIAKHKHNCKIIIATSEFQNNINCHYDFLLNKPFDNKKLKEAISFVKKLI